MGEPLFDLDDLLAKASDPNFTAGLGPVEYLRRLHEGEAMPTPDEQIAALRAELTALREEFAKERRPVYETLGNPSFSTSGMPPSRYLCTKCDHIFSASDETCPICALTARAVRAECDTKRLDWLETSGLELLRIAREPDYTQEDFVIHDPNSAAENSAIAVCDSLREAIDKASAPRPATP